MGASEQVDKQLAAAAMRKRQAGEIPTPRELQALKRVERQLEEEKRWEFYRSIPQKHWREMSGGRQTKVINEQAERYGIPFGGRTIVLPDVVRALHDFFAKNAVILAAGEPDADPPALERQREIKVQQEMLRLQQMEGSVVPRDEVHEVFSRVAAILRQTGETLARQFGDDARRLLDEALDDCQRAIDGDETLTDNASGS